MISRYGTVFSLLLFIAGKWTFINGLQQKRTEMSFQCPMSKRCVVGRLHGQCFTDNKIAAFISTCCIFKRLSLSLLLLFIIAALRLSFWFVSWHCNFSSETFPDYWCWLITPSSEVCWNTLDSVCPSSTQFTWFTRFESVGNCWSPVMIYLCG